jgi:hypothetical protein
MSFTISNNFEALLPGSGSDPAKAATAHVFELQG